MTSISISPNIDNDPWLDLTPENLPLNTDGLSARISRIGILPNATSEGRSTVMVEVVLPDGTKVIAETTLRIFRSAALALLASPVAEAEAE